jgi:hypothetical protein
MQKHRIMRLGRAVYLRLELIIVDLPAVKINSKWVKLRVSHWNLHVATRSRQIGSGP